MNKIAFVAAALTLSAPLFAADLGAAVNATVDTTGVTNAAQQTVDTTKSDLKATKDAAVKKTHEAKTEAAKQAHEAKLEAAKQSHEAKLEATKQAHEAKSKGKKVKVDAENAATAKLDAEAAKGSASVDAKVDAGAKK